jgi:tyrosyl-tRNA synthetase
MPLITKADGTKFGKSEGNAIWLDKEQTSSYEMYQFLVNSEDEKVVDYLKKLTFLDKEVIDGLEEKVKTEPFRREAQKVLGREVVTFLHGEAEYEKAVRITNALFKGNLKDLSQDEVADAIKGFEIMEVKDGLNLVDCLVGANIASSKREAREWISGNSIQVNGEKITDVDYIVDKSQSIYKDYSIIKRGKRNYYVVESK